MRASGVPIGVAGAAVAGTCWWRPPPRPGSTPRWNVSCTSSRTSELAEWRTIYHEIQETEGLDPDLDMDALLIMLWATELGLGMLEAWEVELPKPGTWARLVDRLLAPLEDPT